MLTKPLLGGAAAIWKSDIVLWPRARGPSVVHVLPANQCDAAHSRSYRLLNAFTPSAMALATLS